MTLNEKIKERLDDIKNHPENHRHNFSGLQRCCQIDGCFILILMDVHADSIDMGTNGGVRCDVTSGPCACGAWH